jgi:hypothetical protein
MSIESSESKEVSTIEKRAQWEAMEFRLGAPGAVRVENVSYGEESGEHVFSEAEINSWRPGEGVLVRPDSWAHGRVRLYDD